MEHHESCVEILLEILPIYKELQIKNASVGVVKMHLQRVFLFVFTYSVASAHHSRTFTELKNSFQTYPISPVEEDLSYLSASSSITVKSRLEYKTADGEWHFWQYIVDSDGFRQTTSDDGNDEVERRINPHIMESLLG